jgi:hypothetical protein
VHVGELVDPDQLRDLEGVLAVERLIALPDRLHPLAIAQTDGVVSFDQEVVHRVG